MFGGNNWRSPPRFSWATTSAIRSFLFTVSIWKIIASTGRRTIGNEADNVGTAWWGSCPFFSQCHVVFRQPLPRSMDRTKLVSCVASAITRSRSCWLPRVGPSEELVYAQRCNTRDELWNAVNNTQHASRLWADQEFLAQQGCYWPDVVLFRANKLFPQLRHLSTFLSSCFLLSNLANEAVAIIRVYLYGRFCLPVSVEYDAYILGM
jgi:hypothetical protein